MARYGWPLVFLIASGGTRAPFNRSHELGIRVIVMTFIAHGFEAWLLKPQFLDFIIYGFPIFTGLHPSQGQAELIFKNDCGGGYYRG